MIEIELYTENGKHYVYLANDGSSGCKYEYNTREELRKYVGDYVEDVLEYYGEEDGNPEDDEDEEEEEE